MQGDAAAVQRTLPDASVHCCVTSPPYWGLRDYGHDGQMGLESTPDEYVANMVAVFREVRRVLRGDGTCWLNLGDSYFNTNPGSGGDGSKSGLRKDGRNEKSRIQTAKLSISHQTFAPVENMGGPVGVCKENLVMGGQSDSGDEPRSRQERLRALGLKPKDLVGIPWRVAFALQADGWWLRQDVIWAKAISGSIRKGSAMPESVRDRFCKSHEYVFLLSKAARYFFDSDAVADRLDNGESHEYNSQHENKSVQQMRTGITAGDVQQEQPAQGRFDWCVQSMPVEPAQTVGPQVQRVQEGESDSDTVLLFGEGASNQASVQTVVCTDARAAGSLQNSGQGARKETEIQGASEEVLAKPEGQADKGKKGSALSTLRKREIRETQNSYQAQVSDEGVELHTDTSGMAGNSETIQPPMRLLRNSGATSGNGSCPSVEQGRNAHGRECCPVVQDVQREERQQATATRRSVWLVNPGNFSGAHFATFPPDLVEPMILAGTSAKGCCPTCGAPWERVVEKNREGESLSNPEKLNELATNGIIKGGVDNRRLGPQVNDSTTTTGWRPTCEHDAEPIPCTVLDPFGGSGTVGEVATTHRRRSILIELNPDYIDLANERTNGIQVRLL